MHDLDHTPDANRAKFQAATEQSGPSCSHISLYVFFSVFLSFIYVSVILAMSFIHLFVCFSLYISGISIVFQSAVSTITVPAAAPGEQTA